MFNSSLHKIGGCALAATLMFAAAGTHAAAAYLPSVWQIGGCSSFPSVTMARCCTTG
ncbi:MAG: hypothetical protein ACRETC_02135 [Gammaproteobacteria bacterium]